MTSHPVEFVSQGQIIKGLITWPKNKEQLAPAIVLCHGFAGVKELLLPVYAKAFSDHGYVVLSFDYRGFGESQGEPGRLVPKLQIEDIHAATHYLSGLDGVDSSKIGLWGTSYGGANVVMAAAQGAPCACMVVQLTFANGERVVTQEMSLEEKENFFNTLSRIEAKKEKTGKEMMVNLSKMLSDPQSKAFYERYRVDFPALNIKIPFLTVKETLSHKPEEHIGSCDVPVLIVAAENDSVNPVAESQHLYDHAHQPKELFIVEQVGHYDCYEGQAFERIIKQEINWFDRYLK